jgi:ubiquinone/menaquinone biosynthesis C-methylase UbiE
LQNEKCKRSNTEFRFRIFHFALTIFHFAFSPFRRIDMLDRILEPEVMDSTEDAHQYDAMDHGQVNEVFVSDLLEAVADWSLASTKLSPGKRPVRSDAVALRVLDLGAGTAQIPIELARRSPHVHITAVDAAESMLQLARENVAATGLSQRIGLVLGDAKVLPFDEESFPVVISNSILHHIPEPRDVIAEAIRVTDPGGLLFHRDLARPADEAQLNVLVNAYAGDATPYQRKLFSDSLHAALALNEMRELVAEFGFAPEAVQMTSDRHWTWSTTKRQL